MIQEVRSRTVTRRQHSAPTVCRYTVSESFHSPFWITGFYFQPLWAGLLLPLALVLPFVPVFSLVKTRIELPIIRFIPIQFYEWRANMRENPWVWLLVFVLPLFTFFHLSFPLVAWVLELFALTGLYKQTEDWTFLHLNYTSPRNLLFQKFKTHYSLLLLANLPSVILFHVSKWCRTIYNIHSPNKCGTFVSSENRVSIMHIRHREYHT